MGTEALLFSTQSRNHLILQSQWKEFPRRSLRGHGARLDPGPPPWTRSEPPAGVQTHLQVCEDVQVLEEVSGQLLQVVVGERPEKRRSLSVNPVRGRKVTGSRGLSGTYRCVRDLSPLKVNLDRV